MMILTSTDPLEPPLDLDEIISEAGYSTGYSYGTGGVIVPEYDVQALVGQTTGQGNVQVGGGDASLESWHVENN